MNEVHIKKNDQVLVVAGKDKGVRDFGPGVPRDQLKKIFRLFYRSESELTRETVGTGIGLALVNQLVLSMGGKVDARNRNPGAEFLVRFPAEQPGTVAEKASEPLSGEERI